MLTVRAVAQFTQYLMQRLALAVFVVSALALLGSCIMAFLGEWSWISLSISYQGSTIENAGMYAQIGLTVLALSLCFFLPSNRRIMQLEDSHRSFAMGMNDVTRAYAAVHAADRADTFQLSSEFDAVRERLIYLRDHPELSSLEPSILEVAAQMSYISRELADIYSDEKVDRARRVLEERQAEVVDFHERLHTAKVVVDELKRWVHEVEMEESLAAVQLRRLRAELEEIMPELEIDRIWPEDRMITVDATVVEMTKAAE